MCECIECCAKSMGACFCNMIGGIFAVVSIFLLASGGIGGFLVKDGEDGKIDQNTAIIYIACGFGSMCISCCLKFYCSNFTTSDGTHYTMV